MNWDVLLFFVGLVFIAAWAYSAIGAHATRPDQEVSMGILFEPGAQQDLMADMKVPEVFDERRMAKDLERLASSPTAIGQYLAQAEIRFTQKQQKKVLQGWTDRYRAGEQVIKARTAMAEAYSDYTQLNAAAQIAARTKEVKLANLDADFEEAQFRKSQAQKNRNELDKKPSEEPKEPKLSAEQQRILKKAESDATLSRLRDEKAKALADIDESDEDARMRTANMYDDRIAREEEQRSKYL